MKLKIFYMNDERRHMPVRIMDNSFDPVTCTGDTYVTLMAAEGRVFELDVPENSILYVKKWPEMVMISYIDSGVAHALLAEGLPHLDGA